MSGTITIEHYQHSLLMLLDETFDNVQGIFLDRGTSLFETLATIDAATASRSISPTCATLAAQVEHVRFYLDVLSDAAEGNEYKADWDHIWQTVSAVTPEEWEATKQRLRASYDRFKAIVSKSETISGSEYAVGGSIGVVAHTAYHLGEIRHALCVLRG